MVVKLGNSKDHVHLGFLVVVVVVGFAATSCEAVKPKQLDVATCNAQHVVNRSAFPPNFLFGSASAAYQVEGGAKGGGRGPSNWDTFMHKYPEKIADHSTGDVAIDEYHRYKEDVQIMKDMGMDAYRFSISWSRLLPNGKLSGGVNKEGIKYYKSLIHELLHNGIQPFVTIFHWDVPQALDNEYGGFLSPNIVNDFRDYAELCFREFGNKVKHWITINEPWSICKNGYATGAHAPGRCSNKTCTGGNSGTEPYMVAHNLLLAHAAAVKLYRDKYQAIQKGVIGITIVTHWFVPYSKTKQDEDAASRALDFMFGWFMDPLVNGRYPVSMRSLVGNRLPKFTKEQVKMLKGSYDFIGINYYTAYYAVNVPPNKNAKPDYNTDGLHNLVAARDGVPIGPRAASFWLYVYPKGFRELLIHTKRKYNNPLIYITENGVSERNDPKLSLEEALVDNLRINYYDQHLYYLHLAIKEGVNVKGYFAWSIFDNLEWSDGYTMRFGLNFIDYKNGLKRHPKLSALWFKNFLNKQKPGSKHKPS